MDAKTYFACIDLGSNMCRMIIAIPNPSFPLGFYVKKSFSMLISIGQNPSLIDSKSVARALKALIKCKGIIDSFSKNKAHKLSFVGDMEIKKNYLIKNKIGDIVAGIRGCFI